MVNNPIFLHGHHRGRAERDWRAMDHDHECKERPTVGSGLVNSDLRNRGR